MLTPIYPITTERLLLRPFGAHDLMATYAYHSRPDVVRFLYWHTRGVEETQEAVEQRKAQVSLQEEGDQICLAVVLPENNVLVGEVVLIWRSEEHQQGEIGFVFNPEYGGAGYATEAARAMLSLGFDHFGLHRIFGRCDALNEPSFKLMERLGMRREAHFVQNERFKGQWGDELVYAILREEWTQMDVPRVII